MGLLPISALQHLLYCERQCALIHVEQVWAENVFTAEGNVMHEKAHGGPDEMKDGVRIARGLAVKSETLGLSGPCDVVEFHCGPHSPLCGSILPIEYKRGKPKAHRADEVQLCAQALCLEEMFSSNRGDGASNSGEGVECRSVLTHALASTPSQIIFPALRLAVCGVGTVFLRTEPGSGIKAGKNNDPVHLGTCAAANRGF